MVVSGSSVVELSCGGSTAVLDVQSSPDDVDPKLEPAQPLLDTNDVDPDPIQGPDVDSYVAVLVSDVGLAPATEELPSDVPLVEASSSSE